MSARTLQITAPLYEYLMQVGVRESATAAALRVETAKLPMAMMQISPEQAGFMQMLVRLLGVKRALEVGTFTGYSALAVAEAMPSDGNSAMSSGSSAQWIAHTSEPVAPSRSSSRGGRAWLGSTCCGRTVSFIRYIVTLGTDQSGVKASGDRVEHRFRRVMRRMRAPHRRHQLRQQRTPGQRPDDQRTAGQVEHRRQHEPQDIPERADDIGRGQPTATTHARRRQRRHDQAGEDEVHADQLDRRGDGQREQAVEHQARQAPAPQPHEASSTTDSNAAGINCG